MRSQRDGAGSVMRLALLSVAAVAVLGVLACGGSGSAGESGGGKSAAASSDSSAAASGAASGTVARDERFAVLFLGTSITAGLGLDPDSAYPQQLQRKIDAKGLPFETVNAGVSGETAAGLRQRLDWVLRRPASVIVVETGANDGLRGSPVAGTKATIKDILTRIKAAQPRAKVLLVQMEAPTNLGPEYTKAFHAMFPELARETGVELMPFLLDSVAGVAGLNQADGVHPNERGEKKVVENVWRTLGPLLADW